MKAKAEQFGRDEGKQKGDEPSVDCQSSTHALSLKTVQAYCGRVKEKRGFANLHELQVAATRQAS